MLLRIFPVLALAATLAAQTVHTSDGRRLTGKLVALDSGTAVLQTQQGRQTVPLNEIARITFADTPADDPMTRKGQHILWTSDSSCLVVRNVAIRNGRLHATNALAGNLAIPLERLSRLLRPTAVETPDQLDRDLRDLGSPGGREDSLIVRSPAGKPVAMNGLLNSLDKGQIAFSYEGTDTVMADDTICALVFAIPAKPATQPAPAGLITGVDGSRIAFGAIALADGSFAIQSPSLGPAKLNPQSIAEVQFKRGNAVYLSDLTPTESVHTPFFDDECPWQKDKTASGQPLSLGGTRHDKGLGLHARSRLAYDLNGRYRRLAGAVGIDDELRSGRAILSILGDGKPLIDRMPLDRARPPQKLDVDVRGVRLLSIIVDFADGAFGSGARVSMCDLQLGEPVLADK